MSRSLQSPRRRGLAVAVATVAGVAALAGCGSSKSDNAKSKTGSPAKISTASISTACNRWAALDKVANQGPGGDQQPTAAEVKQFANSLLPFVDKFIAVAPAASKAQAEKARTYVVKGQQTGDVKVLDSSQNDSLATAVNNVERWAHDSCGFTTLAVMGIDYAYQGLPATVKAGEASIEFMNHSSSGEAHMLALIRVKPGSGVTTDQLVQALKTDPNKAEQQYGNDVENLATAFANSGQTGYATVELTPGQYIAACFIGDPPHTQKGMIQAFSVS